MNRLLGALLAGVFGFLLIAPALCAFPASQLPACCRANGKHKCAMNGSRPQSSDLATGEKSVRATCPYTSQVAVSTTAAAKNFVHATTTTIYGPVMSFATQRVQVEARQRFSFNRSRQKRGPPVISL